MGIDKELFKTAVETPTSMSIDTREIERRLPWLKRTYHPFIADLLGRATSTPAEAGCLPTCPARACPTRCHT